MHSNYAATRGLWMALAWGLALPAYSAVFVQCPGDSNGDAVIDAPDPQHPNARCMHLSGGDGFVKMGDGYLQYIFGFSDLTGSRRIRRWTQACSPPTSRRPPSH